MAAISILANQPITPYMLAQAQTAGSLDILEPDETIAPDSPILRAVSLNVPNDRAVGGFITTNDRVDVIATFPMSVDLPVDPETGAVTQTDPETGATFTYIPGSSTKLMWLDVKVITRPEDSSTYIVRTDLQTAEEIAHAQNQGAQFTMALRPETDIRDVDRSNYGETTDTLVTRYNFRVPETIDGTVYPQPIAYPSPFPAEPYLDLTVAPSPSPDAALIEIDVDASPTVRRPGRREPAPRGVARSLGALHRSPDGTGEPRRKYIRECVLDALADVFLRPARVEAAGRVRSQALGQVRPLRGQPALHVGRRPCRGPRAARAAPPARTR